MEQPELLNEADVYDRVGERTDYWLQNAISAIDHPEYKNLWNEYGRVGEGIFNEVRKYQKALVGANHKTVSPFANVVEITKLASINPVATALGYKITHDRDGNWKEPNSENEKKDISRMIQLAVIDPGLQKSCSVDGCADTEHGLPTRCESGICVNGHLDAYSIIRYAEMWRTIQTFSKEK